MAFFYLILFVLIFPGSGWGQEGYDPCDSILRSNFYGCGNRAQSNAMGGSFPLLYDAFNINPASLPIYRTPFGVEYTKSDKKSNVSLIKGQDQWGAGISSKAANSTFFGPYENYKIAEKERNNGVSYEPRALDPNINLSTAANLLNLQDISLPLGIGYKFNREKNTWSPTLGFGLKTKYLTLGMSTYTEKPKTFQDTYYTATETNRVVTTALGLKMGYFLLDYTHFTQFTTTKYANSTMPDMPSEWESDYVVSTDIISATFIYHGLNLSYAARFQDDSRIRDTLEGDLIEGLGTSYKKKHELIGATYRFGRVFSLGYYTNYELDSKSTLVAQVFFSL